MDFIQPIMVDGIKICAWCCKDKVKGLKYCSSACSSSARAHFYPQKEEALNYLLIRQNFQCNDCKYDWTFLVTEWTIRWGFSESPDHMTGLYYSLMTYIKRKSLPEKRPEVDHIIPIHKGGASLGLDNHQVLCYECHKKKTKIDNSGKRSK